MRVILSGNDFPPREEEEEEGKKNKAIIPCLNNSGEVLGHASITVFGSEDGKGVVQDFLERSDGIQEPLQIGSHVRQGIFLWGPQLQRERGPTPHQASCLFAQRGKRLKCRLQLLKLLDSAGKRAGDMHRVRMH